MTGRWRTACNAIGATLAVFAVLTGIMWFGAPHSMFYYGFDPDDLSPTILASFRDTALWLAAIFGGAMTMHWLAVARLGGDDVRSKLANWGLGAAWLLILTLYYGEFFFAGASWLAFVCSPIHVQPGTIRFYGGPEPCEQAWMVRAAILFFLPLLLIALSALLRIIASRRRPVRG